VVVDRELAGKGDDCRARRAPIAAGAQSCPVVWENRPASFIRVRREHRVARLTTADDG